MGKQGMGKSVKAKGVARRSRSQTLRRSKNARSSPPALVARLEQFRCVVVTAVCALGKQDCEYDREIATALQIGVADPLYDLIRAQGASDVPTNEG